MAHTIHTTVIRDLTPDDVDCGTLGPGRGWVDLNFDGVTLHGSIAGLRAVAVEIDRQLARLEVEHRIDQAAKCGTCDGAGEVSDDVAVCPDCGGSGQ